MVHAGLLLTAAALGCAVPCIAPTIPTEHLHRTWVGGSQHDDMPLQVQAHRGGAGMHAESTLYAFAYALDIGADVVEMDALFTKDLVPVVWHDFAIEPDKCFDTVPGANYVGKLIANLTLAELKTLDCGSQQSEGHTQAKLYPGAQVQTLEEVLEFINCYGDEHIMINLETKVDIRFPTFTPPVEVYIERLVPVLKAHGFFSRTILASFDWRSIVGIKAKFPEARVGALIDETLVDMIEGIWGTDWVTAAHATGAEVVCPHHGSLNSSGEYGGTVRQREYVPFTTGEVVMKAHTLGMMVVPWTVDDESTIEKVIRDGVDGVISNYPLRVGVVARHLNLDPGIGTGTVKPSRSQASCLAKAAFAAQS